VNFLDWQAREGRCTRTGLKINLNLTLLAMVLNCVLLLLVNLLSVIDY
jgi:hypothetical protein